MLAVDRNDGLAPLVNIGIGEDLTISELANAVKEVAGYQGEMVFDASKPDGAPRKVLDVSRLHAMGWRANVKLKEGLARAYADHRRQGS